MALTESNSFPLGTVAPDFILPNTVSGKPVSLSDIRSDKGTVIMFICNHCPYVVLVNNELVSLAKEYQAKGISFAGISSNDAIRYSSDSPERMNEHAQKEGYTFPYLYDETQYVARAYDAACTPEFYVFDKDLKLVYHGQMDDARPSNGKPVNGKDLRRALDLLLAGKPIPKDQKPGIGCSIKWKT
ncbi:MAG: thioredoxin family protein [Bacteroidota bacterium]|nr:thioredoxin family protein [Bacteroidota bacterium]